MLNLDKESKFRAHLPANKVLSAAGIKIEEKPNDKLSKKQIRYKKIEEVEAYLKEKKVEKEERQNEMKDC